MQQLDPEDLARCLATLNAILEDRRVLAAVPADLRHQLIEAASRVATPERDERRRLAKAFRARERAMVKAKENAKLESTGIRKLRKEPVFTTPNPTSTPPRVEPEPEPTLRGRNCYVCKAEYTELHGFYDALCRPCGDFNWEKRNQSVRLDGRVALITGARVKIGYQAAIKLLRAGARVVVTTRFPRDAAVRYAGEVDFEDFKDRLTIYGVDLRHTPSVERLARHLETRLERLDFILNNACQTVRRPPGFYAHMMDLEAGPFAALPEAARALVKDDEDRQRVTDPRALGAASSAELSRLALVPSDHDASPTIFPRGELDADLQQRDLRTVNSWRLPLAEVSSVELLEVQLVNAVAPFVLNGRLKPLMLRHRTFDKHIVNVSAMEGQFYRAFKTDKHPHTNMAKAALNMMTRTSAADYAKDGIFMNSVDTGWVTDEDPVHHAERKVEVHGFSPPLDIVDGAARIVAPIFDGVATGKHVAGMFLKDYKPAPW